MAIGREGLRKKEVVYAREKRAGLSTRWSVSSGAPINVPDSSSSAPVMKLIDLISSGLVPTDVKYQEASDGQTIGNRLLFYHGS